MRKSKLNNEQKYFWIPTKMWRFENDKLVVDSIVYDNSARQLFPELYFLLQSGKTPDEISESFDLELRRLVYALLQDFLTNRIISDQLEDTNIFYLGYDKFLKKCINEDTFFDPVLYEMYKEKQLNRSNYPENNSIIKLFNGKYEDCIENRKTYRNFCENKQITFREFSQILSIYRQKREGKEVRYYYAADGGLYPIDIYIYIKEGRIENVRSGLYYYNPICNGITLVSESCIITNDIHYEGNKEIFETSAISVFYIYNAEITMPKYGGIALQYAAIDVGLMVELLTIVAEKHKMGVCSIGSIKFEKIKKYFKLPDNCLLLHTLEIGSIK